MLGNLTGWHLVIILVVILLLFGATKLPTLARSLGQSMRIFKGEMKSMKDEGPAKPGAESTTVKQVDAPPAETVVAPKPADDGLGTNSETRPKP
jgi:sec-independent protein translocase protein TatA